MTPKQLSQSTRLRSGSYAFVTTIFPLLGPVSFYEPEAAWIAGAADGCADSKDALARRVLSGLQHDPGD
jgi:hypothetical protein